MSEATSLIMAQSWSLGSQIAVTIFFFENLQFLQVRFTTSKTKLDIYHINLCAQVVSLVSELLNFRILENYEMSIKPENGVNT